jgi:SNF2 family DNA or RNA helicase
MPEEQANAYENCVAEARTEQAMGASRGTMLKALHRMRGISLHPENPASVLGRPEAYDQYVGQSARLATAVKVLDEIFDRGEKALIFIEYREMQRVFADIVRHRFDLPELPAIINGQTPSKRRQELVSLFQEKPIGKFDAMILSPRAAGVGLNITAANHVIHLSRWWNPAVEDQCNDRAYRIGQEKEVTVYFPIARHPTFGDMTFDVKLDELFARKRALSRDLLLPAESESDYQEIFSQTVAV